jgi:hypothetical protein
MSAMTDNGHEDIFAAFGPWSQVSAVWADAAAELGAEAMRFLAARIEADVGLRHRLLQAKSLEELRHVQAEFVQRGIDDYVAETGRLVEMSEELSRKLGLPAAI